MGEGLGEIQSARGTAHVLRTDLAVVRVVMW